VNDRTRYALAWTGIVGLALLIRALPLCAARPYVAYVDEGNYLHPAFEIIRSGDWDQNAYLYPQLPTLGAAAAMHVADWIWRAFHGRSLATEVPKDVAIYDELEPFAFLLAGRITVLILSLGIVVLTGVLAGRLAGRTAAVAAAFLAALAPALVLRSSVATVDPWATLFVLAALVFVDVSRSSRRPGLAALGAGAMAGCAFASKYPAVLVIVAVIVTILADTLPRNTKLQRVFLALAGLAVAAPIAMPALVLHGRDVLEAIGEQGRQYSGLVSPALWTQAFVRAEWDHPYDHPELGTGFVVLAAGGLLLGLRTRRIAPTVWGWCALVVVSLGLYGTRSFQPFRNLLPIVPVACIAVSLIYVRLGDLLGRPRLVAVAGLLCALTVFGVPLALFARDRARLVDTRVQAIDWLAANSRPGDRGIVVRELGILRQEIRRLPAWVGPRWSLLAGEALATHRPRWLICGVRQRVDGDGTEVTELPVVRRDYSVRFRAGTRALPADRGGWRGNDVAVYVLERNP
jgi:4-amino-4-deoxy-L-arabinose transferase-like glycosyltransferase